MAHLTVGGMGNVGQPMRVINPSLRMPQSYFGIRGLGAAAPVNTDPWSMDNIMRNIPTWLRDFQTAYNAQQLYEINLQRAAQGLPPLNTAMYAPTVNFGLEQQTQQMLLIGGGVLLVALLLSRRGRRR